MLFHIRRRVLGNRFFTLTQFLQVFTGEGCRQIVNAKIVVDRLNRFSYELGAAFRDCVSLTEISIPFGVTSIGNHVFSDCSNLTKVSMPSSLTTTGMGTFYNCINLREVSIPFGILTIEEQTFRNCSSLTEISIPSSVTKIGYD